MSKRPMHEHILHRGFEYGILVLLLLTAYFAFVRFSGETVKQLQVAGLTSLTYVIWGIFHHLYDNDLHPKIVVEYGAIASFGFICIWVFLVLLS